ncbi:hypothetical protein, partial [uncultured Oscillibacter sp.]|uniref:hypothetical protein n=1 Tax=uncultured Oscillibacter sp. TaxID=876091 RepID=UPI00272C27E6
ATAAALAALLEAAARAAPLEAAGAEALAEAAPAGAALAEGAEQNKGRPPAQGTPGALYLQIA